ncbi:hypothetical protein WDU94_003358 [Cyamophila willieti]
MEQFHLQKVEKAALMAAKASVVKPSAGPPGMPSLGTPAKRPTLNVEDMALKIQLKVDPPDSGDKSLLEQKHNLSKDKLEKTVQLAKEEKAQLERKRQELARSLIESLPITAPLPREKQPTKPGTKVMGKSSLVKTTLPSPVKKPVRGTTSVVVSTSASEGNSGILTIAGGGGDVTPSRKSTRLKIENQTLKDYAVDLPESYNTVYTASSSVTLSRTPGKAGRPSKRKLAEGLLLGADSKRFMISYANSRKRTAGLDEDDTANPVIPPLIIENGKEIVDLMLSGDKRTKRRMRGAPSVPSDENLIIVEAAKKKPKEFDTSLVPSASELETNNNTNTSVPIDTNTSNGDLQATEDPVASNIPEDTPVNTSNDTNTNDTTVSDITTPATSGKKTTPRTNTRGSAKASTTTVVADQQVVVDVKGMKAKIPANTWNVTSELGG